MTVDGSDIPSAYVDTTKSYLISRTIDGLVNAGALDMVETRLVQRIDGIIANMPLDRRLHVAELVRMEDPLIFGTLFADEKAALPRLWEKVEAPSTNDLVVGPNAGFGVVDTATPPGPAVPPASLAITTLPTPQLQSAATRLQNLYNADNNMSTVQIADLDKGIGNPGAFTPAEVMAFGTINALFREQAVAAAGASLVISPSPGSFSHTATLGPIGLAFAGVTKIEEERIHQYSNLTVRLTASQSQTATSTVPQDHAVVVINKDSAIEAVFSTGAVPPLAAGPYVVEVWKAGQRMFSTNAVLPATTREQRIDLTDKLDYTLMTALAPLVRNTVSATGFTAKFTFDKTSVPPTGTPDPSTLLRVATPTVKLPTGRYPLGAMDTALLVYPNNVLWVQRGTSFWRLWPAGNGNVPTAFWNNAISASFEVSTNMMSMSSPSIYAVLNASMREI
jgi:hypothetical protein